jgi:hypothetical protein
LRLDADGSTHRVERGDIIIRQRPKGDRGKPEMTAKQMTVALSAWQKMERRVRDQAAKIERLKGELTATQRYIRDCWFALHMIRDCVEELGPAGAVPAEEHLDPEPHHEAEAIIRGIQASVALRTAIEELLDKRIAEALAKREGMGEDAL